MQIFSSISLPSLPRTEPMLERVRNYTLENRWVVSWLVGSVGVGSASLVDAIRELGTSLLAAGCTVGKTACHGLGSRTKMFDYFEEGAAWGHLRKTGRHLTGVVIAVSIGVFAPSELLPAMRALGFQIGGKPQLLSLKRIAGRAVCLAGIVFAAHALGATSLSAKVAMVVNGLPVSRLPMSSIVGVLAAVGLVWIARSRKSTPTQSQLAAKNGPGSSAELRPIGPHDPMQSHPIPGCPSFEIFCDDPYKFANAFPWLKICPCKKMPSHLRVKLEDRSIELLEQTQPSKENMINVVSVGPGGLFQELVYFAKLAKAGYKKIRLITIDPQDIYIGAFTDACDHLIPAEVQIDKQYKSLDDYIQSAEKDEALHPDLLLLIDLTDSKYKVGDKLLSDFSFTQLQNHNIINNGAVISHSTLDVQGPARIVPKAFCGIFTQKVEALSCMNSTCITA